MKVLIFCAVFCFSTSQGLYTYFGQRNSSQTDTHTVADMSCTLHKFTYRKGDYFVLWIKSYTRIDNNSTEPIHADAIVSMSPGMWHRQHIEKSQQYTKMELYLDQDTITIDVQLTTEEACEEVRVLEGKSLPKGLNDTESEYNDSCLGGRICVIAVVTSKQCQGKALSTQPCTYYEQYALNGTTGNLTAFLTSTRSSRAIENSKDGAANTYFIIMIVAIVTSAVAVILLLIIAIRQRCWVRSNPPAMIHISPISENRYYENVVFRTECDPQANQDEQPIYDEPSPDMHYEEINNHRAQ